MIGLFVAVLLAFVAWPSVRGLKRPVPTEEIRVSPMPRADGLFHVYTLPVGQGNAQVIQCPSGEISIFDMGTCEAAVNGFWIAEDIRGFLNGKFDLVRNIFITHNEKDHYSLLDEVFLRTDNLRRLQSIYISRQLDDWDISIRDWVTSIRATNKVKTFNNGSTCGSSSPSNTSCENVILCPRDSGITTEVLSVNAGQQCPTRNKNTDSRPWNVDSIVLEITYGSFKLQLNGDFQDCTSRVAENGPLKKMADAYYSNVNLTVYMLSHHGADSMANKKVIRDAVKPKAVFVSSNPWFHNIYRHPRCTIIDAFINDVESLCKPGVTDTSSPFYCGQHPKATATLADKLQSNYICGLKNKRRRRSVTTNEYAIYSTAPDSSRINLVELQTNGNQWGFINKISSKIHRQATSRSRAPAADVCVNED